MSKGHLTLSQFSSVMDSSNTAVLAYNLVSEQCQARNSTEITHNENGLYKEAGASGLLLKTPHGLMRLLGAHLMEGGSGFSVANYPMAVDHKDLVAHLADRYGIDDHKNNLFSFEKIKHFISDMIAITNHPHGHSVA